MKLDKARNEVIGIIQDSSYSPDAVTEYINQALTHCAGVVDIPEHKRLFTIQTTTSRNYVQLGDLIENYGGRLRRVRYDGSALKIYSSLEALIDEFDDLDENGDIEGVALEGRNLWYHKIPETAVNLTVLCYVNPEPLSRSNLEPDWLPEHVHYKIMVEGALAFIFDQIEDEDSNKPVAQSYYRRAFSTRRNDSGVVELMAWIAKNRQSTTYGSWRV